MGGPTLQLVRDDLDAVVFDLDGVLTDTASLHEAAWKEMFDAFLQDRPDPLPEFTRADYLAHVDGRPRVEGVRGLPSFPRHRPAGRRDERSAGRRDRRRAGATQERTGAGAPGAGTRRRCRGRRRCSRRCAGPASGSPVASSSANAEAVLDATGLARLVEVRVDGVVASAETLPGKPDPAIFVETLRRLGVGAGRAALFEDAVAGVQAGRPCGLCPRHRRRA